MSSAMGVARVVAAVQVEGVALEDGQAVGVAQEEHGQAVVVLGVAADPGTVVAAVAGVDTGGRVTVVLSH